MKSRIFLASALLLAGCQITKTTDTVEETTNTTPLTPSAAQVATKPTIKATPQNVPPVVTVTPQEQNDVWKRISMQMSLEIPENQRVNYYRNWYRRYPGHLQVVAQRAEPFLYLITEEIEKRNLPLELALLPIVESSFDQFAYSHGHAAGLWQITQPTGRTFGLKQDWWYDGRRDVVESTRAALDLLTYLNRKFDGNWLHALAAYNTGEGRVFRAISQNQAAGKPTDFWSLNLPEETSGYVPKLLAVADVIRNHEKYGLDIPVIANKPAVKLVKPGTQMDLAMAASFAGVNVETLQSLNPGYNHWATAPDGPSHLLLPINKVDGFNTAFAKNGRRGMKVIRYQVKSGDSLSALAKKHRTTTKQIQRANNMTGTNIRVGRHLLIPVASQGPDAPAVSLARKNQVTHGNGYRTSYTVRSGDSLWSIARNNNVSVKDIQKWNDITQRKPLRIGQKLTLWKDKDTSNALRTVYYEVQSGDNLSTIAKRYNVKVADVVKWNQIGSQKYLKPGQKLKLYIDVTKVSA
ncbi:LysM peptidoglycan-binding domain-containing protein [Photobacterium ganghwense]|uniref:lytic transglycosylase n=1 Tax=Photobacterium ganghwense TaxID=320778 RepID=UPI0039EF042A